MTEAKKYDEGKPRWDLLPPEGLSAVARIFTYGAAKYADRNWESGIKYGRVFAAAMRHLWAWWSGQRTDGESGEPHLAHAATCILFLLTYEARERGDLDDRPNRP